ncbi:hypothetical protein SAPIO_CDS0232 [Scedosporium apiospermum]|uniref:Uncharacterized protein n=1 Tax=Pseudallescheria apiosperma TaxID=563466 RepID=A0A084GHT3_PSEDA|nr:uncharacterized protein SAPIO_CDS0232 [Scedosporium apiospermum]KEZ46895.1 hypothetical protein SAPIO_CDS0232 [Scedosporium apiospermum]
MIVSDDARLRSQALRLVNESGIMKEFEGFKVGQMSLAAEFENFRQLSPTRKPAAEPGQIPDFNRLSSPHDQPQVAEEETFHQSTLNEGRPCPHETSLKLKNPFSADITAASQIEVFSDPSGPISGRRLYAKLPGATEMGTQSATLGGVLSYQGQYYILTVGHFLESLTSPEKIAVQSLPQPSEDIPTCEISGLSDFEDDGDDDDNDDDDDDDDLIRATSRGSITPEETEAEPSRSSSVSDLDRASCSSSASIMDPGEQAQLLDSINKAFTPDKHTEAPTTLNEPPVKIGEIVMHSKAMDVSLVRITGDPATSLRVSSSELQDASIPLEDYECHIESAAKDTTIKCPERTWNGHVKKLLN